MLRTQSLEENQSGNGLRRNKQIKIIKIHKALVYSVSLFQVQSSSGSFCPSLDLLCLMYFYCRVFRLRVPTTGKQGSTIP